MIRSNPNERSNFVKKLLIAITSVIAVGAFAASAMASHNDPPFTCPAGQVKVETTNPVEGNGSVDNNGHTHYVCITPGPKGDTGATGPAGPTGPQGPAGTNGTDGADGSNGTNGENGADGPQGPAGQNGRDGANGANGTNGVDGVAGRDGRDGRDGVDGKNGLDADICPNLKGAQASAPAGTVISMNSRGQIVCVKPALAKQFAAKRVKVVKVTKVVTRVIKQRVNPAVKLPKPDKPKKAPKTL